MMRNIDLDQFWPQLHPRPAELHVKPPVDRSAGSAPPPLPESAAEPISPPPLPGERATDGLEPPPDLIAAAFAGWVAPNDVQIADAVDQSGALTTAGPDGDDTQSRPPAAMPRLDTPAREDQMAPASDAVADEAFVPAQPRVRHRRDYTAVLWGGSGFIAGMLAWHVIGFWSFVSNVVLNADDPRARTLDSFLPQIAASEPVFKAASRVPAAGRALSQPSETKTPFACVALSSDRTTAGTRLTGCRGSVAHLRDAGFNKRSDKLVLKPRLQDPVAWTGSTAVQVSDMPVEPQRQKTVASSAREKSPAPDHGTDTSLIETGSLSDADLKLDLTQPELTAAQ